MTDEKKSFWSGATGAIAAVTALITAVGGLLAVLIQLGVFGGNGNESQGAISPQVTTSQPNWAQQANRICARTNDAINALPNAQETDPTAALGQVREALTLNKRMVRDLAELTPPPDRQVDVQEFIRLGAGINDAAEEFVAGLQVGDVVVAQQQVGRLKRLGRSFDNAAIGLGATTCAEGASLNESTQGVGFGP
jgi:hypothetical protein